MRSRIKLVPNPDCSGAVTRGPPSSLQMTVRVVAVPSAMGFCQVTETTPAVDNAPYFAALVASSCSTIANACVAVAARTMFGPAILTFACTA